LKKKAIIMKKKALQLSLFLFLIFIINVRGVSDGAKLSSNVDELYHFRKLVITLEKYPWNKSSYKAIIINQDGNGFYCKSCITGKKRNSLSKQSFRVSPNTLEYIYYEIMHNRFPAMKGVMGNSRTYRGNVYKLTVDTNYGTQTVTIYGKGTRSFRLIVEAILDNIPVKYAWLFSG
jgi:hypothetical protein